MDNESFKHHMSPVSIIVAVDEEGGFGKDGKIPWNVPEDMKHFRETTKGAVCVMGRKTYEDMLEMYHDRQRAKLDEGQPYQPTDPEEILPGRECYVVTSNPDLECPGATAVAGLTEAIQSLAEDDMRPIFVLGGYRLWIEALGRLPVVYLTKIKGKYNCDRKFPIQVLNRYYEIVDGRETDECYFVTYSPKPRVDTRRQTFTMPPGRY